MPVHSDRPGGEFRNSREAIPQPSASSRGNSDAADQWFYRLDGRERGPLSLSQLQDLIGSSGQTAELVQVRHVGSEVWIPFYEVPANAALPRARSSVMPDAAATKLVPSLSTSPSSLKRTETRASPWSLRQFAQERVYLLVGILIWGILNIGVIIAWSDPYSTERRYLTTIRQLEEQANALRSRSASAQEWNAFRTKSDRTLAPIVADLVKSASASRPLRQHLLSVARDYLPKLTRPDHPNDETLRLYSNHLHVVERELGLATTAPQGDRVFPPEDDF